MEEDRLFFHRLSSMKVEYEKEQRRTLEKYRSVSHRQSNLTFFMAKEEISRKLKHTLLEYNINELYVEILCLLFPTVESRNSPDSRPLLRFLQKVFNLQPSGHTALMNKVKSKEIGGRVLHLEVLQAKDLPAKDLNGLSDPFCTLYVTTKDCSRRTRVVEKTLNPQWNEHFKFPVKDPQKDFLRIDVWDHDPEERMRDKLKRLGEIKSSRSMGNFMREVTHGRSSTQEFIGKLEIPIKEVSSETIEKWLPLVEGEGEIYLRMTLGVTKDRRVSLQEYMVSLQVLIINELEKSQPMVPFHWEFKFEPWADYLMRQLRNGWGLKPNAVLLAKWLALVKIHTIFPISGRYLLELVKELFMNTPSSEYNTQEVTLMWRGVEEFLNFSTVFVKNLHDFFPCITTTSQLFYILKTLEVLGKAQKNNWNSTETRPILSSEFIRSEIGLAVAYGAMTSFNSLMSECKGKSSKTVPVDIMAGQILRLGQLLNEDLRKGQEMVDKDLKFILGVEYHMITYQVYDQEYGKVVKPLVAKFCDSLKQMSELQNLLGDSGSVNESTDSTDHKSETPESTFAINFFHLYLSLKQFAAYSGDSLLFDEGWTISGSFHKWFYPGLTNLLEIFGLMWMRWMKKAVDMDYQTDDKKKDLIFYKKNYKITSSAFDSAQIIISAIQGFWVSLSWPDPKQSLDIVDKILKQLCGYSVCYAKFVCERLEEYEKRNSNEPSTDYKVSAKLCRWINNIDHVGSHTREIAGQLNIKEIVLECPELGLTEELVLHKQLEIQMSGQNGVIQDILHSMAAKMGSKMYELLRVITEEEGDWEKKMSKEVNNCLEYYKINLEVIADHLIRDYYEEAVGAIFNQSLTTFMLLINQGQQRDKSWKYFSNLREVLEMVKGFLEAGLLQYLPSEGEQLNTNPKLRELYKTLDKCGVSTPTLKVRYYQQRIDRVKGTKGENGMITIRTYYQKSKEILFVEILNARNLHSSDSNGLSDPYVEVNLVPSESFVGMPKNYTKVIKETLYPLFEETFSIKLKESQFESVGFIGFNVFDHDFFMRDDFLGEAFLSLRDVKASDVDQNVQEFPQRFLPLSKPVDQDIQLLESFIEHRAWDKELQAFIKREKDKITE